MNTQVKEYSVTGALQEQMSYYRSLEITDKRIVVLKTLFPHD